MIASGGTAAPLIGYAIVAYGVYETGKTGYEIGSGKEAYTGRKLSNSERSERAGELVGAVVGGGIGVKSVKGFKTKTPTEITIPESITKRPSSFRKSTVKNAWDEAIDGSKPNTKECPTCGKDVKGNPHNGEKRGQTDGWDVDHQPKWSERVKGNTRKKVLDEYNKDVRLRCQSCNRADNQTDK